MPLCCRYVREVAAYAAALVADALHEHAASHAGRLDPHLAKVDDENAYNFMRPTACMLEAPLL